ncbi:MAG: ATP-grasp domain-containing protein [Bryobacterales bacterium]|nr:ATP-grasp domain-containing protein [Bryobacterales bacterium]
MSTTAPLTVLCLASYEKGQDFLRQAKKDGARVLLLTSLSLQHKAHWPVESIDEIFYMPDDNKQWNRQDVINAVSYLARTQVIDRIVPLDDFDLEMAASLREHLRVPGMGETTTRYFRDKLASRMKARDAGLTIPDFVHVLNHGRIAAFIERVAPPWVLKPRSSAGSIGIKKVDSADQLWDLISALGDNQSNYLLERYIAGDIYHVDSIVYENQVLWAIASGYGRPPMDVSHQGGVFTTRVVERGSPIEQALFDKNRRVLSGLGLVRGVSHTEYIVAREDGRVYFLETAARVGGAHIADLVEQSAGINLWAEWARVELAGGKTPYTPPVPRNDYGGLLVSLARQQHPDTSAYTDPEIVWRMNREHHVGFVVAAPEYSRVQELLESLTQRVARDFGAALPPRERPTD